MKKLILTSAQMDVLQRKTYRYNFNLLPGKITNPELFIRVSVYPYYQVNKKRTTLHPFKLELGETPFHLNLFVEVVT